MGLAVPFNLGGLVQGFPLGAALSPALIQGLTVALLYRGKHDAIGEVAVVGNGQHLATGILFVVLHPGPEVAGCGAALGGLCGEGHRLAALVAAIPVHDHAVHVVTAHQGCPLVADEGGKASGLVVLFGRGHGSGPGILVGL